jgi:hypothetical protein
MVDDRSPEMPHSLLERCLGWIMPARRHAPVAPGVAGPMPRPVSSAHESSTGRPIVEHTRAGDVYRL